MSCFKLGKINKKFVALGMVILSLFNVYIVYANPTHGNSTEWVDVTELKNTPPTDYVINKKTQGKAMDKLYNEYFLDDGLQEVRIEIDKNNLNYLLQNAKEAPYVMTDSVTIGDTTVEYAGFKTKGDYTLIHSYDDNPNSDRFSFTVNFGKYINKANYGEKQTFYGCEKISFNNLFFDRSMLKEYVSYKLLDEMGLPVPQYGLARLYINGDYYGVYFMVEALEESILEQYYGVKDVDGLLGKPRDTTLAYEQLFDDPALICDNDPSNLADYEEMVPIMLEWSRKLTNLSRGLDFDGNAINVNSDEYIELLSRIMDVEETVKYFATHSWLCQTDSMFAWYKNYGLYISEDGVSTVVPWDYDLSFGCYGNITAQIMANYELDKLYNEGFGMAIMGSKKQTYEQFPMFYVIYQNEQLMEKYYEYMGECSKIAALGGYVESSEKFYEPGFLNDCIEALEKDLIESARMELASNVYYMNDNDHPADMKDALPHIKKIIAMRAVGVKLLLENSDYVVCGEGCNLRRLGNGVAGMSSSGGKLVTVDESTGIYVGAAYNNDKISPMFSVTKLDSQEAIIYKLHSNKDANGEYLINIPASEDMLNNKEIQFYLYNDGKVNKLNMKLEGNIFSGVAESLGYVVIGNVNIDTAQEESKVNIPVLIGIILSGIVLIILIVVFYKSLVKNNNKRAIVAVLLILVLLVLVVMLSLKLIEKTNKVEPFKHIEQMVLSAKEPKEEPEVIVGKIWWENYENSKTFMIIDDGKLELDIKADKDNESNNAFCVEIYDDSARYFTTTSEGDAWYSGTDGNILGIGNAKQLKPGMNIKVVITRKGNDFTFEYYNSDNMELMQKITTTENGKFSKNLKVRVMAQIGKYTVEEVK